MISGFDTALGEVTLVLFTTLAPSGAIALVLVAAVLLFPIIWELDGIWLSIVGAEVMSITATVLFLIGKRKRYGY